MAGRPVTTTATERPARLLHAPLAPLALAVAAGILVDRFQNPCDTRTWALLAVCCGLFSAVFRRLPTRSAALILAAFVGLGGGWHHARWSDLEPDDLARGAWETPRPAWLRGVLAENPEFRAGERRGDAGQTRCILEVSQISDGRAWHPASGRILISVSGDRASLGAGEAVFAAGSLTTIAGPLNPGEFDRREFLRAQAIRLQLSVGEPAGLWPDARAADWPLTRSLGIVRAWCHATLVQGLDPNTAPLAAALLLGRREAVDPDVNDAFLCTGTTHLLAISGLHLQVLALALFWAGRIVSLPRWWAFGLAAAATISYALLVGPMPSVVRSAAMTVAVCLAAMRDRGCRPANVFALAALATLAFNPANLFDIGCQLSFLAVAALFWGVKPVVAWIHRPAMPLDELERRLAPRWKKALFWSGDWLLQGVVISTVVWLATLPLVALRFHMISPVGILLNIPLVPLTSAALLLAGLALGLSAVWGPLGRPAGWACERLLAATESIVRWGGSQTWGHSFTVGPPVAWALAFYALLGLLALAWAAQSRARWAGLAALGVLVADALVGWMWPAGGGVLEAEVLAVGHGLAVVIQSAPGRAVLYDCGRMADPHVGRRLIAPALWARGVSRLDAVVLSHPDSDHYNALPDLLDRFRIGAVLVPPGFAGPANPAAARLIAAVRGRGVRVRTFVAGDGLDLGTNVTARALHPAAGWKPETPDNDRSIVLDVSSQGRRFLLTGDLDGSGQAELLSRPSLAIDAFLAPHHGGRSANPPQLYDWAKPGVILVSQRAPAVGTRDALTGLAERKIPALRTWQRGAIRLRWDASGLKTSAFLDASTVSSAGGPSQRVVRSTRPIRLRAVVLVVGLVLGALFVFVLIVLEWGAWALVQPGRRPAPESVEPPPWQTIAISAEDGTSLVGSWRAVDSGLGRTAVLLHGFAEEHSALLGRAESLVAAGWSVALPDTRGRGRSAGAWTTFGGREAHDLRLWIDALAERVGPEMQLMAWGRSMGAAIALRAAAEDSRIRALVLEAPYPDLRMTVAAWLARVRLPGVFAGPILHRAGRLAGVSLARPRPVDLAPLIRIPVMILHGSLDPIIAPAAVRRLVTAFPTPPTVIEVAGARHADILAVGGPALAIRIAEFLDEAVRR